MSFIPAGETLSRSWAIDYEFKKIPRPPFSICYEVSWETLNAGGDRGQSVACSSVRRLPDGKLKVTPKPTRSEQYMAATQSWVDGR